MSLAALVPAPWRTPLATELASPTFTALARFVEAEWAQGEVFPPRAQVFAALALTPPEAVRVVLLGQDPYPTKGNANGLAFSVARGVKPPASLKNLFLGLEADLGHPVPPHGDLTAWATHGVLLLNTVLTVREGAPQSHQKQGWESFTRAVLTSVAQGSAPVVFLCLGKPALKLVESLRTTHPVVAVPHPSPLNGRAFVDTVTRERTFSRVNALLSERGGAPVDWALA